jgi:hypothetical protein
LTSCLPWPRLCVAMPATSTASEFRPIRNFLLLASVEFVVYIQPGSQPGVGASWFSRSRSHEHAARAARLARSLSTVRHFATPSQSLSKLRKCWIQKTSRIGLPSFLPHDGNLPGRESQTARSESSPTKPKSRPTSGARRTLDATGPASDSDDSKDRRYGGLRRTRSRNSSATKASPRRTQSPTTRRMGGESRRAHDVRR